MELFYLPNLDAPHLLLVDDQLRHAVKVLRKRAGDIISVTDGRGQVFRCELTHIDRREAALEIVEKQKVDRPGCRITIAMALTKNIKRIEWAIEKMTEMGIYRFVPLIMKRSERDTMNHGRMEKIMVSAMKQSQQLFLPLLEDVVSFRAFLDSIDSSSTKLIGHKAEDSAVIKDNYTAGSDVTFLIGPEGDFTNDELEMAREAGFAQVILGNTRLRTETAAVAAVAYIHALNS